MSQILTLKLADLIIDNSLSGRTDKEIKDNAKALKPELEAKGGWDYGQPGQVFMRDSKPHLLAGFTRTAACVMANFDTGFFVEVEDRPEENRLACIRTNGGRGISRFEQGRIFAAMRDGTNPETAKTGEPMFDAMSTKEIAKITGKSPQHIEGCICIFEETPEIGELIAEGKVAANVIIRAKQLEKDDGKRLRFIKAIIKQANEDGKDCATIKHLDAIKPEWYPIKAAGGSDKKPASKKKNGSAPADDASETESETEEKEPEEDAPEKKGQSMMDLGAPTGTAPKRKTAKPEDVRRDMIAVLLKCDEETVNNSISNEDAEAYVDALLEAGFGLVEMPL